MKYSLWLLTVFLGSWFYYFLSITSFSLIMPVAGLALFMKGLFDGVLEKYEDV